MTDCFVEERWESLVEKDDLVKLLQELQNRKGVLEKALAAWKDKNSDIINLEEELEFSNFCSSPLVRIPVREMDLGVIDTEENNNLRETLPKPLNKQNYDNLSAKKYTEKDSIEKESSSWFWDQYLDTEDDDNPENYIEQEEQYFEVSSATPKRKNSDLDETTLSNLLERLKETHKIVVSKSEEFEGMISDVSKAANESLSLRERVGMTHRSLTMIEMRQEKVMREALYENVTANCTIRKLHDEVIQLRIRESQQQSDIQRLMAENSRLKMKLMEARFHGPVAKTKNRKSASTSILPEEISEEELSTQTSPPPPTPASAGLHEIDNLDKPVCSGVIQRGSLSLYKTKDERGTICVSDESLFSTSSNVRNRKKPCPLCSDIPEYSDSDEREENTRSVGTSTADIENIVAHRTSIVVMGMVLPIPLFLACLLRTIEESMLMIGRVCFAELPPFDPSFPELHDDVMDSLKELYAKVKQKIS